MCAGSRYTRLEWVGLGGWVRGVVGWLAGLSSAGSARVLVASRVLRKVLV
jgi:hypothetical protein